ncbi:MAG: hypothetical protein SchgKO_24020 [Schleiferiaceae bacterium]
MSFIKGFGSHSQGSSLSYIIDENNRLYIVLTAIEINPIFPLIGPLDITHEGHNDVSVNNWVEFDYDEINLYPTCLSFGWNDDIHISRFISSPIDLTTNPIPSTGWRFSFATNGTYASNLSGGNYIFQETTLEIFPNDLSSAVFNPLKPFLSESNENVDLPLIFENPHGDSLFVEFTPSPLSNIGVAIPFDSGYSDLQPLPGINQGKSYDPYIDQDGVLHFESDGPGNFFVAYTISGYRMGQLTYKMKTQVVHPIVVDTSQQNNNHRIPLLMAKKSNDILAIPQLNAPSGVLEYDVYCSPGDSVWMQFQTQLDTMTSVNILSHLRPHDNAFESISGIHDSTSAGTRYVSNVIRVNPESYVCKNADSTQMRFIVSAYYNDCNRDRFEYVFVNVFWGNNTPKASFCEVWEQNQKHYLSIQAHALNSPDSLLLKGKNLLPPFNTISVALPYKDTLLEVSPSPFSQQYVYTLEGHSTGELLDSAYAGELPLIETPINNGVKISVSHLEKFHVEYLLLKRQTPTHPFPVVVDSVFQPQIIGAYSYTDYHPSAAFSTYSLEVFTGRHCVNPYETHSSGNNYTHWLRTANNYIGQEEWSVNEPVVYPNPTTGMIYIDSSEMGSDKVETLSVWSLSGQLLMESQNQSTLDISSLVSGVYILRMQNQKGEMFTTRIVKQ